MLWSRTIGAGRRNSRMQSRRGPIAAAALFSTTRVPDFLVCRPARSAGFRRLDHQTPINNRVRKPCDLRAAKHRETVRVESAGQFQRPLTHAAPRPHNPETFQERDNRMRTDLISLALATALTTAATKAARAADDFDDVGREIAARHDEAVKRLQDWIALPSIAAENLNSAEGAERMAQLAREAGFQKVTIVPTDGKPGVFATLDAGAAKTVGLYFMYDVKQFDPAEWTSPPLEARIVDKPGFGKVIIGRGAVNQKGPEAAFLAALHAIRGAGEKMPVNLVLVAEGEEEIGSPHIGQIVHRPEVEAALRSCVGVFMPSASQDPDGVVTVSLGAKGVVELELVSSGEKWGRGPGEGHPLVAQGDGGQPGVASDQGARHAGLRGRQHDHDRQLSQAAPALGRGARDDRRGLEAAERGEVEEAALRRSTGSTTCRGSQANERLESQPTVNIEGLVGGYTGPGGKTILPHRAVAKIDLRLVPDMKKDDAVAALKAHLATHGFGDIEVNVTGGYDPTSTPASAPLIQAQIAVLEARRDRPGAVAAQRRLVPGLRVHGRAAEARLRTLRSRPRQRRARPGRVLRDRVHEPEGAGLRRRGDVVRPVPLRAREVTFPVSNPLFVDLHRQEGARVACPVS